LLTTTWREETIAAAPDKLEIGNEFDCASGVGPEVCMRLFALSWFGRLTMLLTEPQGLNASTD
jgi:hypothetical protein